MEQDKLVQVLTSVKIEKLWKEREPWLFLEIVLKLEQKRYIKIANSNRKRRRRDRFIHKLR